MPIVFLFFSKIIYLLFNKLIKILLKKRKRRKRKIRKMLRKYLLKIILNKFHWLLDSMDNKNLINIMWHYFKFLCLKNQLLLI